MGNFVPVGEKRLMSRAMEKRCLFIAYAFPPVGGAGVQRASKFVKYLPAWGWSPTVLAPSNPSVPLFDESLCGDIPPGTPIYRARTREPGYAFKQIVSAGAHISDSTARRPGSMIRRLARGAAIAVLQPDPQVLWLPAALRAGLRALRERPHRAVIATAPPFSSLLLGAILSRLAGLPLIVDYRDEWTLSNAFAENRRLGPISRMIQARMQRRVLRSAGAVITTTHASARALTRAAAEARSSARVMHIYNGFDPDDFAGSAIGQVNQAHYRLVYTGTLWNLTSVAPLVEAIQRVARRRPELMPRLEVILAGRRTADQQRLLDPLKPLGCRVTDHPYLEHRDMLQLLNGADALCVLLSALPGAERVVPAKIFEYMAARRAILAITPRGEAWELLRAYPAANLFEPAQVDQISVFLEAEIERGPLGIPVGLSDWSSAAFDRRTQAGELAALLDSLSRSTADSDPARSGLATTMCCLDSSSGPALGTSPAEGTN